MKIWRGKIYNVSDYYIWEDTATLDESIELNFFPHNRSYYWDFHDKVFGRTYEDVKNAIKEELESRADIQNQHCRDRGAL